MEMKYLPTNSQQAAQTGPQDGVVDFMATILWPSPVTADSSVQESRWWVARQKVQKAKGP